MLGYDRPPTTPRLVKQTAPFHVHPPDKAVILQNGGRHSRPGWTPARTLLAGLAALVLTFFVLGALFQGHIAGLEVCRLPVNEISAHWSTAACMVLISSDNLSMRQGWAPAHFGGMNISTSAAHILKDAHPVGRPCVCRKASAG